MKPIRNFVLMYAAISATGVLAQGTQLAPPPPPPPPSVAPPSVVPPIPPIPARILPPGMNPGRFMSPIGMKARFTYEVILTNRDELKVTDAQIKIINEAREAADKTTYERAMTRSTLTNEIQALADADTPDMAKLEVKVQELMKMQGDEMMADFKLNAAYRKALTPEQRVKITTMAPKFNPMMPNWPGMRGGPIVPGDPGGPGMPGMMPGAPGGPGPVVQVVPKPATPARTPAP